MLDPGAKIRVRRYGRLYGAPPVRMVYWDGETLRAGTPDEVFPPTDEEEIGELL